MLKRYSLKWNGGNLDFFETDDGEWVKADTLTPRDPLRGLVEK